MGLTTTATKYSLSVYYDKLWLERLIPETRWFQLCEKRQLPKQSGKVMKFTSLRKLAVGSALTEGTLPTPATLSTFNVTATLRQYGGYAAVSDFIEMTAISSIVQQAVGVLAEQSALTLDTYLRNVAFGGGFPSATSRISAAARSRYIGSVSTISAMQGKVYGFTVNLVKTLSAGVTKRLSGMAATLNASAWANYKVTLRDLRQAVNVLRSRDVKPFNDGFYVGLAHPAALAGIMDDTSTTSSFAEWNKYTNPEAMYKGEVGKAEGIRFISSSNAMDRGANTGSNISASFITIVGKGALGCVDFDMARESAAGTDTSNIIIKKSSQYDTNNPLNQFSTIGWKFTIAGAVLNTSCGIHIMSLRSS
jgi:N4-gp56 family major capsid protein